MHIVDVDLSINIRGDQSSPISTNGTVLDTEASRPHIESLATHTPMAELRFQVKRSGDKRLSIGCPGGSCYGFAMVVNRQKATAGLDIPHSSHFILRTGNQLGVIRAPTGLRNTVIMLSQFMKYVKCTRVVNYHTAVPARRDQFRAIMREFTKPYFVRVLAQFYCGLKGEIGFVTHMIRI